MPIQSYPTTAGVKRVKLLAIQGTGIATALALSASFIPVTINPAYAAVRVDIDVPDVPEIILDDPQPGHDTPLPELDPDVVPGINLPKASIDVEGPKVDIDTPDVDIDLPKTGIDVDGPKVDIDTRPDIDVEGPKVDIDIPDVDISLPKTGIDVDGSKVDVDPGSGTDIPKPYPNNPAFNQPGSSTKEGTSILPTPNNGSSVLDLIQNKTSDPSQKVSVTNHARTNQASANSSELAQTGDHISVVASLSFAALAAGAAALALFKRKISATKQ